MAILSAEFVGGKCNVCISYQIQHRILIAKRK
ncbi:uncharacterized protein CGFF_03443 [Nakaseomyces glabratus]|nr:uncharacterized protein CGFF_03443 [Nakaseomyces glabratus]